MVDLHNNINLPEYGIAGAAEQQTEGIELLYSSLPHKNKASSKNSGESITAGEEGEEGNNGHNKDNNNSLIFYEDRCI